MTSFYLLSNQIRDYAWGHLHYIPDFLGIPNPLNTPFAEMWMGAHPLAPSMITDCSGKESKEQSSLSDLISEDAQGALGKRVEGDFKGLPFLFKLLAAGKALSIQAHPSKTMAEDGFRREEEEGIARDAPGRNYRDDNHKPEIIMAVTRFTAMIGFRKPVDILHYFSDLDKTDALRKLLNRVEKALENSDESALRVFLEGFLSLDSASIKDVLSSAATTVQKDSSSWSDLQKKWVRKLLASFPDDIGVLAPLFLHVVELEPGEALYQPARALHAYLEGFGLELMANSDNVLRGGLTHKHVDVPELMRVLDFQSAEPDILKTGEPEASGICYFSTPAKEFKLGLREVKPKDEVVIQSGSGPLIILVMEGELLLESENQGCSLKQGMSVFIPWNADRLILTGNGKCAFAGAGK